MVHRLVAASAFVCSLALTIPLVVAGENETGVLRPDRPTQEDIREGRASLTEVQVAGLRMFTSMFNRLDGYGDGPIDPNDTTSPGGRPTLQGNGMFLRVNGLDAQACLECHSIVRTSESPPLLGIGGVGGSGANAMFQPTEIDVADTDTDGNAAFNGRFINPPFVFGAGGVELLGLEMTAELQALKQKALANPNTDVDLITKGVDFGILRADVNGVLDYAAVQGVDDDLVVKPFGRKGEFATIRDFDVGALAFHMGMQPVETVGADVDGDGDGVVNEARIGDLSALSTFIATLDRPIQDRRNARARRGYDTFHDIGCADCHKSSLTAKRRHLPLRFPEVATDPTANIFLKIDLTKAPMNFERAGRGIRVPLFADLKRHDMGDGLKEDFAKASDKVNREFTTARLWGVADTAPYLHDGRATTLTDAILAHGGEAQDVRDRFAALDEDGQGDVLAFLRTLRTPKDPARRVVERARAEDRRGRRGPKSERRSDKSRRSHKSHKSHKSGKSDKSRRSHKSGKSDRSAKPGKKKRLRVIATRGHRSKHRGWVNWRRWLAHLR